MRESDIRGAADPSRKQTESHAGRAHPFFTSDVLLLSSARCMGDRVHHTWLWDARRRQGPQISPHITSTGTMRLLWALDADS